MNRTLILGLFLCISSQASAAVRISAETLIPLEDIVGDEIEVYDPVIKRTVGNIPRTSPLNERIEVNSEFDVEELEFAKSDLKLDLRIKQGGEIILNEPCHL